MIRAAIKRHWVLIPALVLSLHSTPSTHGADLLLDGILPGGAAVRKSVNSIVDRRFTHIVRQETDFSCGAAALATILNHTFDMNLTEMEVIQGLFTVTDPNIARARGFSMLNIKRYLETQGMRGRGYKVSVDMLEKIKVPTLVLLDIKGYKHFAVLKRTAGDKMYVADPALGNRVMTKDEFLEAWGFSGVAFAILGRGLQQDNALRDPEEVVSARDLIDVFDPVPDVDRLEFGHNAARLF